MSRIPRLGSVLLVALLLATAAPLLAAQQFPLTSADLADSAAMSRSMPRLAGQVMAAYRDSARERYLDNRFRLDLLTGRFDDAAAALEEERAIRTARLPGSPEAKALHVQHEIYARARRLADQGRLAFSDAYARSFRETFARLDDPTAALVSRALLVNAAVVANDLRWATPDQSGRDSLSMDESLTLLHVYAAVESYRGFAGLPAALVAEDEARRYLIEQNVAVRSQDGATVCAVIVRPRGATGRLPTLLQFTIYADSLGSMREALRAASHGYAGVTGFTRGKACSPDKPVPYVHDGADATALIDWIAAQPWSDGRVGMYGGSYSGFTAWAAAGHRPSALKAILVGASAAPGIDVPMEGNVFWNFVYPWPFYTTNDRWLDNATYNDFRRWNRVYRGWYVSGRPWRELDRIDGTPNPGFAEWIAHPALDAYWQAMLPDSAGYAGITIPVLQTAGYWFGGPGAAIHYWLRHAERNPRANHYLLIGPWDHFQAQRGVITQVGDTATWFAGYEIDPVAQIDLVGDLRYQWFDHVLRGGPRPALLRDRVNYQVTGANAWKHAPSIAAASNGRLRLWFDPGRSGTRFRLATAAPRSDGSIPLTVNLADRSDADARSGGGILAPAFDSSNAVVLVSEPLEAAIEVTGLLSGHLELVTNKRDFDFVITPYELMPDGQYFQLSPYTSRASHVASLSERRLLEPGKVERLNFSSGLRMMSHRFVKGSRVVLVVGVVKNQGQQVNYGTGKDVSDESIADAGAPLSIRFLPATYIEFPVWR